MSADTTALLRLAGEIDDLGRRLGAVGAELRAMQASTSTAAAAEPASPAQPAFPAFPAGQNPWVQAPQPQPQPPPWPPAGPTGQPQWAPSAVPPPVPRRSLGEVLSADGAGSRLLAWVGGAVTLLGVVLLLVLAVQRGWLGPLPRVLVGAAFGLGLVGTGLWLHRTPAARTGAFALAATGIAVLYLDTIAASTLYGFLPVVVGLTVALGIAVGGLVLAVRWDSALLGAAVVLGCAVCAPMITDGFTPTLVVFLLVVQVATAVVRRGWPKVALGAGVPPRLASMVSTLVLLSPGSLENTAAAVATGVVGVALALWELYRRPTDAASLTLLGTAVIPTLLAALFLPKAQAVGVVAATAVVLIAVAVALGRHRGLASAVAAVAGLVALLQATVTQFDGSARTAVLLGEALVLTLIAHRIRHRVALYAALGFGVLGTAIAWVKDLPPTLLAEFTRQANGFLVSALIVAALILAIAILLPWAATRQGALTSPSNNLAPWLFAGAAVLYGAAGLVLSLAMLSIPGRTGFLVGHVLITVSWTLAALALLVRGIDSVALRVVGLTLVGAAVVKLVLFDLSALDGMARVAVFLGAGLVLLTAGTRYARLVANRTAAD
ncbi:hypothetical membrane protein [Alloactinosynnema sp. L-07]|uniref:DUF2339 domain-containing protein n=1 Tax=Alloactinosynnema sp. L-07 TaxID=1653480 RepID=UPI00065EFA7F|nr:DUF2339 domain-containing protein [Alloactinosynnema sp. L-07]CRK58737.1 hypothetical membrane protein [Alloactinosynnema sp. L-07]